MPGEGPRSVSKIITAQYAQVAPDFEIRRPMPLPELQAIDPFLLLDHMGPKELIKGKEPGVPDHPHRGFEPVTFVFQGAAEHKDSQGNHGIVNSGGVQWMTAGSGIVHSEQILSDPDSEKNILHGIQLWINLPKEHKMTKPGYQNIPADTIPVVEQDGSRIRVIAGEVFGVKGPAKTHTPLWAVHVELQKGSKVETPVPNSFNAFYYILEGEAHLNDEKTATEGQLVLFSKKGDSVMIKAKEDLNVLFLAGEPINEPIASYGPFVMNTMNEIQEAIVDFEMGKMGKIEI